MQVFVVDFLVDFVSHLVITDIAVLLCTVKQNVTPYRTLLYSVTAHVCIFTLKMQDYFNLQQLMEEASSSRDAARTSAVVSALVQHIMVSWREHFARSVAMKFNCFFLIPFIDDFPFYLRQVPENASGSSAVT